ncbi:MAG: diaminopimelate epimerase [Armatimonadota bacterium]
MKIKFTKMHGLGNDFIIVDGRFLKNINYKKIAVTYCRRAFGIGSDGLIILAKSGKADFKMLFYNPDGSTAAMCGNGIRCLAKYIYNKKLSKKKLISIETPAGVKEVKILANNNAEVSLGKPVFEPGNIPVKVKSKKYILNYPIKIKNKVFNINCVSFGNPHCVIFINKTPLEKLIDYADDISNSKIFPEKANVEFVHLLTKTHIKVFVWERGAGPTLACGTGAAAAAVISHIVKGTDRKIKATLPGGNLYVTWDKKDNQVYLRGPAETVFEGEINI